MGEKLPCHVDGRPDVSAPDASALARLAEADHLLVCCDFDGTLSHLVDDPGAARPVPGAVEVLDRLGTLPGTSAAVLSGRALEALEAVAGMPAHVTTVGSHGVEFSTGVISGLEPSARDLLNRVTEACADAVDGVDGAAIETKPASVAVHVRRASQSDKPRVLDAVATGPATWPGVHVTRGKDVIELAVVRVGKGGAIEALKRQAGATAALFVGDDVTDEDAFSALGGNDVSVKVGAGDTVAHWRVDGPEDVVRLLSDLATLRAAHTI